MTFRANATSRDGDGEVVAGSVRSWLIGLSAAVLTLVGWLVSLSYSAGERSRQLDVNTQRIEEVDRNGTSGTKARLDDLTRSVDRMSDTIDHLNTRIDTLLGRQQGH